MCLVRKKNGTAAKNSGKNRGSPREGTDFLETDSCLAEAGLTERIFGREAEGNEALDPQSVPLAMRRRATQLASESGLSGLKQCAVDELHLDEAGITLVCKGEHTAFLYADYNYENIEDTDCLPAVAEYLVQHMRGYYNITRSFYSVPKANGHVEEKTREVTVVRHHEDTPFAPGPVQKQHLF